MKNIIVTGAYVNNKGAQSMLFTVVDEIRKKYPNSNISVLVNQKPDSSIINTYNFNFISINTKDKLHLAGNVFFVFSRFSKSLHDKLNRSKFEKKMIKTDLIIDVSGFALSSEFTRNNTINYLSHISLAQKYSIPIYLFPQSFGPFNYNKFEKNLLMFLIKKYLKYPTRIYAREKDGYDYLKKLSLKNIDLTLDTVFQKNDEYDLDQIYNEKSVIRDVDIHQGSVAIIPNVKTINNKNESGIYNFYREVINELIKLNKQIYLIRHSTEDLEIIKKIYQDFKKDKNVNLIEEEYSSIELHQILKKFDFVVASRYHSIVHSYKAGTPALVLGWAVKYNELLQNFNQSKYQFDVNSLEINQFISKLREMNNNFNDEKSIILNKLKEASNESIFDEVLNDLSK